MCGGICGPAGEMYEYNTHPPVRVCAVCHRTIRNCSCVFKKAKTRGGLKKKSKKIRNIKR